MQINNKEKQFAQGNWGSDKWTKEHTEVDLDTEEVAEVKYIKSRKGKKNKKPYVYDGHCCPFCAKELPKKEGNNDDWVWVSRIEHCPNCGALEVSECPACKRSTWFRCGWYKHQSLGCGFSGSKKETK